MVFFFKYCPECKIEREHVSHNVGIFCVKCGRQTPQTSENTGRIKLIHFVLFAALILAFTVFIGWLLFWIVDSFL